MIAVGAVATVIAYQLSIARYFDFLLLLGAIFVPLFGAVFADQFRPAQPMATAVAWVAGFITYQWLSPSSVHAVFSAEQSIADATGLTFPLGDGAWGASVPAFAVAFGLRLALGLWPRREPEPVVRTAA